MTDHVWWACHTCGHELYDSRAVYEHRQDTGHIGAGLCTEKVPTTGPGSTEAARRMALEAAEAAVRAAREKRTAKGAEA